MIQCLKHFFKFFWGDYELNTNNSKNIFKNKKVIAIAIVVVLILVALLFRRSLQPTGTSAKGALDTVKFDFTGYNAHGSLSIDSESRMKTFKQIAQIEGQKAKVKPKTMRSIIDNAQSPEDLTNISSATNYSSNTSDDSSQSSSQSANLSNYVKHYDSTAIYFNKSSDLKNGDKIKVSIVDKSPEPYIKEKGRIVTVKGLKTNKTVHVNSFKKYMKLNSVRTNKHGAVSVILDKDYSPDDSLPGLMGNGFDYSLNDLFKTFNAESDSAEDDKTYSNGDKISISEKKLAKYLTDNSEEYNFVGRNNKNVTFKVSGLKNPSKPIKNFDKVSAAIAKRGAKVTHGTWKLVSATMTDREAYTDPTDPGHSDSELSDDSLSSNDDTENINPIQFIYQDTDHNKYYQLTADGILRNGKIYNSEDGPGDDDGDDFVDEFFNDNSDSVSKKEATSKLAGAVYDLSQAS